MENHRQSLLIPEIPPKALDAVYVDSKSPYYNNNLFIDSLRPALGAVGLKNCLTSGNRNLPDVNSGNGIRKQAIRALVNEYFVPVHEVLDLYDKIDCAIKDGYKSRGSNSQSYQQQLVNFSCAMKNNELGWRDHTQQTSRENSFFVYSEAGSKRLEAIQRCLHTNPQVLWHNKIHQCQIVHLTVDLSGIQTPLEYCAVFLKALEDALGPEKYAYEVEVSGNVSAAFLKIESLVLTYNVGILVVESLDSINDWQESNKVRILKHFHSLGKSLPIVYSATTDVFNSVALDMPWMLSALSLGSIYWDPLKHTEKTSKEAQLRWSLFTKRLWKQQCLRSSTVPLTEEIKAVWYDACQGIVQLAMNFFSLCQIEAISSGEEVITVELMRRVRRKESKPLELMLMAYKNNDLGLLSIIKGAGSFDVKSNPMKTLQKKKLTKDKKVQPSSNQMPPDFKKIPKKDWCKLPEDDLRYKFAMCEKGKFYQLLKSNGLVLSMQDLMGNVQLSKPST
ncbi:hypothetical protein CJF42_02775 [Pseudoalteromonas sp. NBT06-2]|uniref:hypothetical protein n=1 Tax=Pseudoalteromonas sp. NBT06-2 TaxID=2025950 RepID=UPI000BA635D2|nr:hypothetical protein [Pseudoalteromonas sp. NBT06-2]PAJ75965.1 hypothetical protein CJF42_02775 [Pseudoalteromonas sp. NBT06-2]